MKVHILAFGIAKDIFHSSSIDLNVPSEMHINDLKVQLEHEYPELAKLCSYRIAVNQELAGDACIIKENDELAIIPPVSGG